MHKNCQASASTQRAHNNDGKASQKERLIWRPTGTASAHAQKIPSQNKMQAGRQKGKHIVMVEENRNE